MRHLEQVVFRSQRKTNATTGSLRDTITTTNRSYDLMPIDIRRPDHNPLYLGVTASFLAGALTILITPHTKVFGALSPLVQHATAAAHLIAVLICLVGAALGTRLLWPDFDPHRALAVGAWGAWLNATTLLIFDYGIWYTVFRDGGSPEVGWLAAGVLVGLAVLGWQFHRAAHQQEEVVL